MNKGQKSLPRRTYSLVEKGQEISKKRATDTCSIYIALLKEKQSQGTEAWRVCAILGEVVRGTLGEMTYEQRLEETASVNHMGI